MASEGSGVAPGGNRVIDTEDTVRKIKKVRQAICINNNVRNRTAIGKTQIHRKLDVTRTQNSPDT